MDKKKNNLDWNTTKIYKDFTCSKYKNHKKEMSNNFLEIKTLCETFNPPKDSLKSLLKSYIEKYNISNDLYENLYSYAYVNYSENTNNTEALKEMGKLEEAALELNKADSLFKEIIKTHKNETEELIKDPDLQDYSYFLKKMVILSEKQMTPAEEDLASDLARAGGESWGRLQETISSNLSTKWNDNEVKSLTELRNLAHDPDRKIREKAFTKELELIKSAEQSFAYSLNGVKGFAVILEKRRNWENPLEKTLIQSGINQEVLDSLIKTLKGSTPIFRKYLKSKAKYMGLKKLAFYDLFAPINTKSKEWSINESKEFIIDTFSSFSERMGNFAEMAFDKRWIDYLPKKGKIGGAYCISFPLEKESRVLSNYSNNFSSLTTIAHELGHAYHHEILKDSSHIHREYPMTLAETASTFAETLVFNKILQKSSKEELPGILDYFLQDSTQIIIDILSRFIFESKVFEKRKEGELSPEEFCTIMKQAQKETYGDALDEDLLHPFMWAVKIHYYNYNLGFYNYPYAFGQLFSAGLYSLYEEKGKSFAEDYDKILFNTARRSAVSLGQKIGFNLENQNFWDRGINSIKSYSEMFEKSIS